MSTPVLVVCGHGTKDLHGQQITYDAVNQVRARLADTLAPHDVHEAYVDVQGPTLDEVLAAIEPDRPTVVVPFLLAGGYHLHVDIPKATAGRTATVITAALGPDPRLAVMVIERLHRAGATPGTPVILAPAGSSDARSQADNRAIADRISQDWGAAVDIGHVAGVEPTISHAVQRARDAGTPVTVASYLLAPGYFQHTLESMGADICTAPLAPDTRLIDIVIQRYTAASA